MPRNPDKQHCSVEGCNAWAIRGSDPDSPARPGALSGGALPAPKCSAHSGKVGAPEGNQNRLVHGFYATAVLPDELDDLGQDTVDNTLAAEIAITRVALRRVFRMLLTGQTPGPDALPLAAADYVRLSALAFRGAGAISRLLRVHHELGGQDISPVTLGIARGLQKIFEGFPESLRERWLNEECTDSELFDAWQPTDTRQDQR